MRDPRDIKEEEKQNEIDRLNSVYEEYTNVVQDGLSDMAEEIADMVMTAHGSTNMNVNEWLTKDLVKALKSLNLYGGNH